MLLKQIENIVNNNFPFLKGRKLLLAVSGGIDSIVMADVFRKLGFDISIAHCNFQLRGEESFGDEKFVQLYANKHRLPLFIEQFDTIAHAEEHKQSIQLAARELRYNWFYELLEVHNLDYIITAHHADDNMETFFINLIRGTGLEGLTGIPTQNNKVVRPFLYISRNDIENYVIQHKLKWREDSSNASDKYLRNKIRHLLIPVLKEMNLNLINTFHNTQKYLRQSNELVKEVTLKKYKTIAKQKENNIYFDLLKLKKEPNYKTYLYQWLYQYGFTAWEDIYNLVDSMPGKQVYAEKYRLIKDRNLLILCPVQTVTLANKYEICKEQIDIKVPINLTFTNVTSIDVDNKSTIFVDSNKLVYPLVLRKWNNGDVFQPFGMAGKQKKISKLFIDEKLSLLDKENTWLLCSEDIIVWVVGIRQDERFKVDNTTKSIIKIEFSKD